MNAIRGTKKVPAVAWVALWLLGLFGCLEGTEGAGPSIHRGTIRAAYHRSIAPSANPRVAHFLSRYQRKAEPFPFQAKRIETESDYVKYEVTFPSPYTSDHEENNTVWCEYYRSTQEGKRPAVVVLHILDGQFMVARIMCDYLARLGCHALLVKMPYYGERRPAGNAAKKTLTSDTDTMMKGIYQTVLDVRRAAAFLAAQGVVDEERVGLCGVSLGAFATALTAGVDGKFPRSCMVLGGGDFAGMVMHAPKEISSLSETLKAQGVDYETLRKKFVFISPMTYAHRIPPGTLLMINGKTDKVVPPDNAEAFWKATTGQEPIHWYDCSHYTAVNHIIQFMEEVGAFFAEEDW